MLAPRRLVPVVVVAGALAFVQASYSRDLRAATVPLAMSLAFIVLAPATWRLSTRARPASWPAQLAFVAVAVTVVAVTGRLLPRALDLGPTYMTDPGSLLVATVLFVVGGWGLGRDIELERDLAHTQLLALRAHLDPHFLYNTLNAIAEWCQEDPAHAEEAILRLSTLLQAVFAGLETRAWPLQRELDLARDLVTLHEARDPSALSLEITGEGPVASILVSPLLLLLLVENAIKHGARKGHRGAIKLGVRLHDDRLELSVWNPGPFSPTSPGHGLAMLRRRLDTAYGRRARFAVRTHAEGTLATLQLLGPPR